MVLLAVPLAVALLAAQAAGAWPHGTVYGTDVPRAEHAAIVRWAARLPRDAVVISRVPYLWENLGVYTAQPEFAGGILEQTRNLYLHIGLFSTPAERASVENWPKQCVSTAAGEIWLVSHP
jgi:ferric-dicitrate binding protein FerR (iron transport regulator)